MTTKTKMKTKTDDSSDDDNSIDPELAREKFAELRTQYEVTRDTIKAKGRSHASRSGRDPEAV